MEFVANRPVVELELRRALASRHSNPRNTVLLLRAAAQWHGEPDFTFEEKGRELSVTVAACGTVLAVLDALAADRPDGQYLVVLTPCDTRDIGGSVLAIAMQPEIRPIDRWDLVKDSFGARSLDPSLTKKTSRWIAEALLDAQPVGGWRRLSGTVLSRATALNRLAATRLGMEDADDSAVDAAALLQWTTRRVGVEAFFRLSEDERAGLIACLGETTGGVADVLFAMTPASLISDAVPFGLVAAALYGQPAHAQPAETRSEDTAGEAVIARVRAEERYFGGSAPDLDPLRIFGEVSVSLVTRWADNGHASQAAALCEQAEVILNGLAGTSENGRALASRSKVLGAGLDARLTALADALNAVLSATESPSSAPHLPGSLAVAESALAAIRDHGRKRERDSEIRAAASALRVARWLTTPEPPPATLAEAATRMLRFWAWADRALNQIARADTGRVPSLAHAYAALWDRARQRRAGLDEEFARKLAAWTEASSTSDDLLLVENLLNRIGRPLAEQRLPVIVILDGMTAAAGTELAAELTGRGDWLEAGRREDGREPVLAIVPSVTSVSRTSLLTGTLKAGGQAEERAGFAAFWGRRKAQLFHKADLVPEAGRILADRVRDAIAAGDTVVAVVLNTIDDALDKGKQGAVHWTVDDVIYLRAVIDEARRAGRPVVLTADHGHVLDRPDSISPVTAESARYRTGIPGPGEIAVRGPRVLLPGQEASGRDLIAAVDEKLHYTQRKAGYHGGASLAEVVVPVFVFLPSDTLLPSGWSTYDTAGHAPIWWDSPATRDPQPAAPAREAPKPAGNRRKRPVAAANDEAALFDVAEVGPEPLGGMIGADSAIGHAGAAAAATLGSRVIASPRLAAQRQIVRRAPADAKVVALLDALLNAGGRLTLTEAATVVGEPPVRMSGYLAQVARLLNVDGYAVLRTTDEGRTVELSQSLLRQQFIDT
jgi:hypothetical protein